MDWLRQQINSRYRLLRDRIFERTKGDPERAHELFVRGMYALHLFGLDEKLLNFTENNHPSTIELSNAAGFNKNADLLPSTMHFLGFERVVVGTVTYEPVKGQERPRIMRVPETESMVNWMGLPGIGAEKVAANMYRSSPIPITVNVMATPGKKGDAALEDLEETVKIMVDMPNVDRIELNISCPNTKGHDGEKDSRGGYQSMLGELINVVAPYLLKNQKLYLKISPDMTQNAVYDMLTATVGTRVSGITATNTTTIHDKRYILESPDKGGASGNAVYDRSLSVQKMVVKGMNELGLNYHIIGVGGNNSVERVHERVDSGASGIQILTPIIYQGPQLLFDLRKEFKAEPT